MKRAFSADDLLLRLPGALPQASGDTAPLALNTYKERPTKIIAVIFHTRSVIKPGELPRLCRRGRPVACVGEFPRWLVIMPIVS